MRIRLLVATLAIGFAVSLAQASTSLAQTYTRATVTSLPATGTGDSGANILGVNPTVMLTIVALLAFAAVSGGLLRRIRSN